MCRRPLLVVNTLIPSACLLSRPCADSTTLVGTCGPSDPLYLRADTEMVGERETCLCSWASGREPCACPAEKYSRSGPATSSRSCPRARHTSCALLALHASIYVIGLLARVNRKTALSLTPGGKVGHPGRFSGRRRPVRRRARPGRSPRCFPHLAPGPRAATAGRRCSAGAMNTPGSPAVRDDLLVDRVRAGSAKADTAPESGTFQVSLCVGSGAVRPAS